MNILSTPTANTRNGMTSTIIRVDLTFIKLKRPIDAVTDNRTITTPHKPNIIFESIFEREIKLKLKLFFKLCLKLTKSLLTEVNSPKAIDM